MLTNIILPVVTFILGFISEFFPHFAFHFYVTKSKIQPLNKILGFGKYENVIFVAPGRTDFTQIGLSSNNPIPTRIIQPIIVTEDFLAINNIKSSLLKAKWEGHDSIMQDHRIMKNI